MRLLLPPSESKNDGTSASVLEVACLSFPELTPTRAKVLKSLGALSAKPNAARTALGISEKQDFERLRNLALLDGPTSPAADVYCGVVYDSFAYGTLTAAQKRKADASVLIQSALFGWVSLADRIPAYRLSGDCVVPRVGGVGPLWKKALRDSLDGEDLIVDLRSGTYAKFWQPKPTHFDRTCVIKVMQTVSDASGTRKIAVSHFNKATKGLVTRDLITSKSTPKAVEDVVAVLKAADWVVEHTPATASSAHVIEVIIKDVVPQR